jgi:hypothetical protein
MRQKTYPQHFLSGNNLHLQPLKNCDNICRGLLLLDCGLEHVQLLFDILSLHPGGAGKYSTDLCGGRELSKAGPQTLKT